MKDPLMKNRAVEIADRFGGKCRIGSGKMGLTRSPWNMQFLQGLSRRYGCR